MTDLFFVVRKREATSLFYAANDLSLLRAEERCKRGRRHTSVRTERERERERR